MRPALKYSVSISVAVSVVAVSAVVYYSMSRRLGARTNDWRHIKEVKLRIRSYSTARLGDIIRISSAGGDDLRGGYGLWVYTTPDCVHCEHSLSFHRSLILAASRVGAMGATQLRALLPSVVQDARFLDASPEARDMVLGWEQVNVKPPGTPHIYLTDEMGRILRDWPGKLSAAKESEVLLALHDPVAALAATVDPQIPGALTSDEVQAMSRASAVVIVSILDRKSFRPGGGTVVNIPLDELAARAPEELSRDSTVIADCAGIPGPICTATVNLLRSQGYRSFPMQASKKKAAE